MMDFQEGYSADKVKAYFDELRRLYWRVQKAAEALQEAAARATSTTSARTSETYTGGGVSDRTARAVITLDRLRREYISAADKYIVKKNTYIQQLHVVEDTSYINILYGKYFAFKTFRQLSNEFGTEYRWLCKKHGYALEAFYNSNRDAIENFFAQREIRTAATTTDSSLSADNG